MFPLALLVLAAAPGPAGFYRDGATVLAVAATKDPKAFTLARYFEPPGDLGPLPLKWDPATRILAFQGGGFLVSADGKTLTAPPGSGRSFTFVRLTPAEADQLPAEKALRLHASEANVLLKSVYVLEMTHFAENDRFAPDLAQLGFEGSPCADGTRAPARKGEVAGCLFTVRLTLTGTTPDTAQFTATATGIGLAQGLVLTVASVDRGDTARGMIRIEK